MHVFFMRHGEAVTQAESDISRSLSENGRNDVRAIVSRCLNDEIFTSQIDEVWCSHYLRAQQTAELVSTFIHREPIIKDGLAPTDNPDQLMSELRETDKTILIVSHQPLLGTIVDRFAGLETGRYRMGTSAVAAIQTDIMAYGCGELRWLYQP